MVLVSHIYKFIYFKNHKVAGSSVESFFGQYCIDPLKKESYNFQDVQDEQISEYGIIGNRLNGKVTIWNNHKGAEEIKRDLGSETFNNYFKFCVVRNPYDLVVSSFFWKQHISGLKCDFKTYCRNYKILNGNTSVMFIDNTPICQYYIRYENLKDDIITVLKMLDIRDYDISQLPKHKSGINPKDKPFKEYYDKETKEIVKTIFKKEIDLFNYSLDDINLTVSPI